MTPWSLRRIFGLLCAAIIATATLASAVQAGGAAIEAAIGNCQESTAASCCGGCEGGEAALVVSSCLSVCPGGACAIIPLHAMVPDTDSPNMAALPLLASIGRLACPDPDPPRPSSLV